ncbi:PLP-dependent aminotransferase family protein [Paeniglutamicibacter sp. ABSL32-1]|uniref:aminotransferase-like domain-containing protein n=1 Tax=Paeniglutamicibacter quisquiliarum TaxID=2849498 RepID=UPI001C2D979F|nr:PLP-dependent aminotransferase family protein [Paeniglutamicibacter quisquiliarum]MBV1777933.1 PLP-dependent aminotransferase family protein [Paeniglutamicibacter quisquiliarum]
MGSETEIAMIRAAAHESLLSERASHIKQSAVRDVFELSLDPSLVSLAGGNPYLQSLPLEKLGAMASELIATQGMTALQYGSGQGTEELRNQICEVMAEEGITGVDPNNIVVTTGSQAAQDVACKVFCNPGDTVLCEDPTYVGALNTFEAYQVRAEPVATDEHGLVPAALRQRIAELREAGARIKFLYTIPNFNNPSGITLAAERRAEIAEICIAENILILEDNPYGMLRYTGEAIKPLRAENPDHVIYMGSFSKILAPGLRIGWAVVPTHLFRRFYLAAEAVTLCPATFNQMLISKYLAEHDWRGQIQTYRELYASRCEAMLQALDEYMPEGVHYTRPEGGFFIWVTLPEGIDTYGLLSKGIEAGVVFIPGAAFSPLEGAGHRLRLAFSAVPEEKIREGVKRLAPVLAEAIAANGVR